MSRTIQPPEVRNADDQPATQAAAQRTTPTNGFRAFVRRRELVIFFVLSYLIAWSTVPFGSFLAFSPLVSAIVVVAIAEGLPGLARLGRRLIRWRVNWIWYAAAIGLPLLVHAVAIGLNMAAGAPAPSGAQFQPWYAVLLLSASDGQSHRGARWERSRAGAALRSLDCNRSGHHWRRRHCSEC